MTIDLKPEWQVSFAEVVSYFDEVLQLYLEMEGNLVKVTGLEFLQCVFEAIDSLKGKYLSEAYSLDANSRTELRKCFREFLKRAQPNADGNLLEKLLACDPPESNQSLIYVLSGFLALIIAKLYG